nr:hypothetical protein [uncultured Candidatus Microthrix sp.]
MKPPKLATNERLRGYVQDRLSGAVTDAEGKALGPPGPTWKGRNQPHRRLSRPH